MNAKEPNDNRKLMDHLRAQPSFGRLLGFAATTFEMQVDFFETDFLPTLFGLGAWDDRNWSSRIALLQKIGRRVAARKKSLDLSSKLQQGNPTDQAEHFPNPMEWLVPPTRPIERVLGDKNVATHFKINRDLQRSFRTGNYTKT